MKITDAFLAAFAPHRSVCSLGDVVLVNVPAVGNALGMLRKMGLPVSKRVIENRYTTSQMRYTWEGLKPESHTFSWDFVEEGTEDLPVKNNLANYNPDMGTVTIFYHTGKETVGRPYGIKPPAWKELWAA